MTTMFSQAARRVEEGANPHDEAAVIVAAMTLDEKLGCLDGDTPFWPGLVDMTSGGYYTHPWPAAKVERLGVPGLEFSDGPRGAVIVDGTAFPVSMARGAIFDPTVEERVGDVIGLELRAAGATFTGAVCMNLLRHPAWGRAQETYGDDPHHVGEMAAAFTRGLQRHVMACMKHFALNSMENARFRVDVAVDERALHEVYLPHFRRVAAEGVASTMSAYNSVNGEWCGENAMLLTDILRSEWGWDGFVVSDFIFGLRDAVASVRAGLDVEMPFRQQRAMRLGDAVASGDLEVGDVDRCVQRIVATLLRFRRQLDAAPSSAIIGSTPHRALAREVASAAAVLLRNDGELLPVDATAIEQLVVLGPLADRANLGDGGSSDVKSTSVVTPLAGLRAAMPTAKIAAADDLSDPSVRASTCDADLVVVVVGYTKHDEGEYIDDAGTAPLIAELFPPMDHPDLGFAAPTATPGATPPAASAGIPPDTPSEIPAGAMIDPQSSAAVDEPETLVPAEPAEPSGMSPGGDRTSLRLSASDEALIAEAASLSDRVVVVVQCGSAVMMPWADSVQALVIGWYGGVEGGNGLADVLVGAAEPGGRLPFVIPTDAAHLPYFDKDADVATYDLFHGQWLLDRDGHAPQFPFGAGAGYTRFELGDARLDTARLDTASAVAERDVESQRVVVEVRNTGERAGSTVVFAFAGLDGSTVERPRRRLIGFASVHLDAGDVGSVAIDLDWSQLDVRRDGRWWTEPGEYLVEIGQYANDPAAVRLHVAR
ncbi:MAG: glycoside hydrolase family 3 C-terminal domain-containing protein [Ilumatobacter sp.]|uniref:beta-glucosidase family protein n=1 Tax=Ilumatobacter sp. TaxID=1967498 RepID=UPI00391BC5FD